ncbi:MAG TPA: hypothetical protein VK899_04390, partial [Gemmatimonadales bacterium]|nr:hypothetical protein [Gemmatimonadales bacterium]
WEQLSARKPNSRGIAVSVLLHAGIILLLIFSTTPKRDDRGSPAQDRPQEVQMVYLPPKAPPPIPKPAPKPPPAPKPQPAPKPPPPPPPLPRALADAFRRPPKELALPGKTDVKVPEHDKPAAADPRPEKPTANATAAEREDPMVSEARRLFGPKSPRGGNVGPVSAGLPVSTMTAGTRCPFSGEQVQDAPRPTEGVIEGIVRVESDRRPIPGAFLQVLGTGFSTFADQTGHYRLRFDPALVDVCRSQLVRVTAPGYRARTMILSYGQAADNSVDLPAKQ